MNKTASAELTAHLSGERTEKKDSRSAKEMTRNFTTHPHVLNIMLKKYVTGKVLVKKCFDTTRFAQPSSMAYWYFEKLLAETFLRGDM